MLTQHFPYAIYSLTNQSKLLRSPTNQTPIDEMKPHFPIFHSHFHLLHSAKFSLNYLDTGIAGEAASALKTRQGMLTKREIPTSLTLNQHTYTHTHELAHTQRQRGEVATTADAGTDDAMRMQPGEMLCLGLSLGLGLCLIFPFQLWSASILVFVFWLLWKETVQGATELSQKGCGRGRQFCCRWLFCILIACRAEKYATKLTLACNLLPPPHQHLLLSLSVCDLHFAAGQRHSKFASNFVCLLPPEPATNASSITPRTRSRLSLQFAQITQPAPPPTPRFPSAFIIKCLRRLMELPKLKHLAHT